MTGLFQRFVRVQSVGKIEWIICGCAHTKLLYTTSCTAAKPQPSAVPSTTGCHLHTVLQALGQALIHVVGVVGLQVGQHCSTATER